MNTKKFIQALAIKLNISQKEAEVLLGQTTGVIREVIAGENKLTLLHLGSFHLKKTASRSSYIPALDKKALMPPKNSVGYNPAESLRDRFKNTPKP